MPSCAPPASGPGGRHLGGGPVRPADRRPLALRAAPIRAAREPGPTLRLRLRLAENRRCGSSRLVGPTGRPPLRLAGLFDRGAGARLAPALPRPTAAEPGRSPPGLVGHPSPGLWRESRPTALRGSPASARRLRPPRSGLRPALPAGAATPGLAWGRLTPPAKSSQSGTHLGLAASFFSR